MLYNYVDTSLDDNLICCICRTPFNEPVTTRTCFHTFCQECIFQALRVSNHCPIDRSPLSVELLGQADPIVRHLVEELAVRCPHLDAGCEYTGERHLLESHLKLQCLYVQVPCPCSDEGCRRTVARKGVIDGKPAVHQESDPESDNKQTAACESCKKDFPGVSVMKDHLANSCPEKIVTCRQVDNGCTWRGRRVSLETHTDKCPYESIKGFFDIHSTKMAQLTKDNERLRHRTDELEGTVRLLRQEVEWAKIALGPWYRPVYPGRPSMPTSHTQRPNEEGSDSGSVPSRVGPILLHDLNPTGDTSRPDPRGGSDATDTFDFFDPFSFISQRQRHVSSINVANDTSTTTGVVNANTNPNTSPNTNNHAIGSDHINNLNRDATYEFGPSGSGSSNGSGSTQEAAVIGLSPGASNLQSASAAPLVTLFSDYFPSEDQAVFEEGGSPSRVPGWQHVSSPPNHSPGIHSPNQPPISGHIYSHSASPHPVPYNRPQSMPSINKHAVAPLNLSTTVEGSLVGLRESLVTLSAALESQGRRLELALTTEGLRASEEVGSLKAIVQGLRMQVHAIMMDRNALVTGRIGGVLNIPSNLGGRTPGPGGATNEEDPNEDHGLRMSEEGGPSPGGPRFMEGYTGGLWGFPTQQQLSPGVTMAMMGPNFPIGPPHPSMRFNHIGQGVLPMGGLPIGPVPPHHPYIPPTGGSGPKL